SRDRFRVRATAARLRAPRPRGTGAEQSVSTSNSVISVLCARGLDSPATRAYSTDMRYTMIPAVAALVAACATDAAPVPEDTAAASAEAAVAFPDDPAEPRLRNLRMLTNGGENAEAYFSADGRQLIFQRTREGESACDQIYIMNVD